MLSLCEDDYGGPMRNIAFTLIFAAVLSGCNPNDAVNGRHSSYGEDHESLYNNHGGRPGVGGGGARGTGPSRVSEERRREIEDSARDYFDGYEPLKQGQHSVDKNGMITGPNVNYQISNALTSRRGFAGGRARAINLHMTAGRTCKDGGTRVPKGFEKPHIYICRNGEVIVNGTLNRPRTSAEAAHNDYTLNIEFEAAYAPKGTCRRAEGALHCYEKLTANQMAMGAKMMKLMSSYHKIPLKPALNVATEDQYYSYKTYIAASNRGMRSGDNAIMKSQAHGIITSYQTRFKRDDDNNHDDMLAWSQWKQILEMAGKA